MSVPPTLDGKVALITGAAKRIGAAISRCLHEHGAKVVIHYRGSADEANALCDKFNAARPDSAMPIGVDLSDTGAFPGLIRSATEWHDKLDILINNASSFYPTPLGQVTEAEWAKLIDTT